MSKNESGGMLMILLLLGGGGVLLLGCLGCVGGGVYFFAFRGKDGGGGPGLFAKAPQLTDEKVKALDYPMTSAEVDAHLGGQGQKATRNDVHDLLKRHKIEPRDVKPPLVGQTYTIYHKDNRHLIVGFISSKKYGELSVVRCLLEKTGDNTTIQAAEIDGMSGESTRDRIEILNKTLAEPRWLKGKAIKPKIVGVWRKDTVAFDFKEDGKLVQFVFGKWRDDRDGSYKFVDDDHIEMAYAISDARPPAMDRSVRRVLLDGDEMILIEKRASGRYAPVLETYKRDKGG